MKLNKSIKVDEKPAIFQSKEFHLEKTATNFRPSLLDPSFRNSPNENSRRGRYFDHETASNKLKFKVDQYVSINLPSKLVIKIDSK